MQGHELIFGFGIVLRLHHITGAKGMQMPSVQVLLKYMRFLSAGTRRTRWRTRLAIVST